MSLHYLLDGYNILHQISALTQKDLDEQRRILIVLIELQHPQGSLRNKVTLVFDGRPGLGGVPPSSLVKVIFTWENSADEKINDILQQAQTPRNFVVVTDDRAVQYAAKSFGATVCPVSEFISRLNLSKLR